MKKEAKFYVYALLDPRKPGPFYYGNWKFDFEPFYVGKGYGKRAYVHDKISNACNAFNPEKNCIIQKIKRETGDLHYIVTKRKGLTEQKALDLEILLISRIGRVQLKAGPLVNKTQGGDGMSGTVWTTEAKMRVSQAVTNAWAARTHVEKKRIFAKVAATNAAKPASEKARKAKYHSEALRTRSKAAVTRSLRKLRTTIAQRDSNESLRIRREACTKRA
jgi:hypothetical protein